MCVGQSVVLGEVAAAPKGLNHTIGRAFEQRLRHVFNHGFHNTDKRTSLT